MNKNLNPNDHHPILPQEFVLRKLSFINRHLEVMAANLEACRLGKIRRLIVNVLPRNLRMTRR